jgi:hypothetical protein
MSRHFLHTVFEFRGMSGKVSGSVEVSKNEIEGRGGDSIRLFTGIFSL